MARYYPIMVDIRGRRCLVIGGGTVATRKVSSLLEAGGKVVVVSPRLHQELHALKVQGVIEHLNRDYRPQDLQGAVLIFAATDDPEINSAVCREAKVQGVPVNSVTRPEEGTFAVPAMLHQGELTIAISTGGVSPALAQRIRQELEKEFGEEYAVILSLLEGIRPQVLQAIPTQQDRQILFDRIVNSDLLHLLKEGKRDAALTRLATLLREAGISVDRAQLTVDRDR
ncbi:MAG: bifunctional precorrin-2 dehydrogenase/sirohydrochlorin ferrochelatase [Candidatus Methylomirabilales bacterium]